MVAGGLILATAATRPWQFDLSLGVLVVGGSVFVSYIGHSMLLPHWFVRRRGLATEISPSQASGSARSCFFPGCRG
jgi:hypothetical protein